ncbi:TPA: FAD-binding oxidoreductase [Klebsiella oxytoca]|nr:FAD-binding oxidoreductase [Klebsiella oxytoca]
MCFSKGERHSDPKKRIVVVGAGITGTSIAWHLAQLEFDVTIVEQDILHQALPVARLAF